ncbi:MAG TPA: hypothetical protein VFG84_11620 [Gemmatimonadaceae bacterium]|nr:hypothetical protein [Gemmatimonadaceae bacterium]
MNDHIRERILRKLDGIPDDRAYQVLDYVEFLESKYSAKQGSAASLLTRFSEGVEDTMRAGKVSTAAIAETMGLLNKAMGVLNGVAAAGKSVASDIVGAASSRPGGNGDATSPSTPASRPQAPATPPSDSTPGS